MPQNHQAVQSIRRFRAYVGSEHTSVQSIRRFRAYAGSERRSVRVCLVVDMQQVKVLKGLKSKEKQQFEIFFYSESEELSDKSV